MKYTIEQIEKAIGVSGLRDVDRREYENITLIQ